MGHPEHRLKSKSKRDAEVLCHLVNGIILQLGFDLYVHRVVTQTLQLSLWDIVDHVAVFAPVRERAVDETRLCVAEMLQRLDAVGPCGAGCVEGLLHREVAVVEDVMVRVEANRDTRRLEHGE